MQSEEAMRTSYLILPAVSTMGGKWLGALHLLHQKEQSLPVEKPFLIMKWKIEKLKQAEQQALKQGDAQMLRNVFEQTQKIEDQLSNTLLSTTGAIEKQAITETGDILTKQIGDEGFTDYMASTKTRYMEGWY